MYRYSWLFLSIALIVFYGMACPQNSLATFFPAAAFTAPTEVQVVDEPAEEQTSIWTDSEQQENPEAVTNTSFFSKNRLVRFQLLLEDFTIRAYWRLTILNLNRVRLLHDIDQAFMSLTRLSGFDGVSEMLIF